MSTLQCYHYINRFMGDWYVLGNIPTFIEVGAENCIEHYDWDDINKRIDVTFTYNAKGAATKSEAKMRAIVKNDPICSLWSLNPQIGFFYLPIGLSYIIPYIAEDESFVLVGVPDRSYLWIMTRQKPAPVNMPIETANSSGYMSPAEQERILKLTTEIALDLGFDVTKIQRIKWTS